MASGEAADTLGAVGFDEHICDLNGLEQLNRLGRVEGKT